VDGRLDAPEDRLEACPALTLRRGAEVLVVQREQVPADEAGRRLRGEHLHPGSGRMNTQQEGLEVQLALPRDHDLAIDDATGREGRPDRIGELREVAVQRLEVTTLDQDLVAVTEDDGPEPVPLRFVEPAIAVGQAIRRLGQHGLKRRIEGEMHPTSVRARC
jgi:hypothetical protein